MEVVEIDVYKKTCLVYSMSRFGNYFSITEWGIGKVGIRQSFTLLKCATNQNVAEEVKLEHKTRLRV